MSTVRTFIAIDPSAEIRQAAARLIGRLDRAAVKVRWVEPDSMHLTLVFLGEIETERIPDVCDVAKQVGSGQAPFTIEFRGAGAFPTAAKPRTLWLGVSQGVEALRQLHGGLEAALAPLGYRAEHRQYQPHLTLGRLRQIRGSIGDLAEQIAAHDDFEAGATDVAELVVYSSGLDRSDRTAPTYTPLGRARLEG